MERLGREPCPLPWVEEGQELMLVLAPDAEVAHVARVAEWRHEGRGRALCGAEVRWALCIDEQTSDERPCLTCITASAPSPSAP